MRKVNLDIGAFEDIGGGSTEVVSFEDGRLCA